MNETNSAILNKDESFVTHVLLYGKDSFKDEINSLILNAAMDFIVSMERIDEPLYRFCLARLFVFFCFPD